jgi:tetratricopeptide (TPR) repeat protein
MFKRALEDADEAIRLDDEMASAYYTRAVIHKNMGKLEKARKDVQTCIDLTEDPDLERAAKALMGVL